MQAHHLGIAVCCHVRRRVRVVVCYQKGAWAVQCGVDCLVLPSA